MKKLWTGSELAMNKFFFKQVKQIELINLVNRGSNRLSSSMDVTDFGWRVGGWLVSGLDGIKAILSPAGAWAWAELGNFGDNTKLFMGD